MNGIGTAKTSQPEPGRRTSARVSARAKSTPQSTSKRKRNGNFETEKGTQDGQSSQEEEEEEEDTSESEDEQDEEEAQERARRIRKSQTRPPSKRAKTKGDLVHLTIRTAPKKPGKSRKPKPAKIVEAAKEMGGLYGSSFAAPYDSIDVVLTFLQRRSLEKVVQMIKSFQLGSIDSKSTSLMLLLRL